MEPSLPTSTAVRGNSGDKDVVIRSARGGGEIFRASNVGEFRKWVRGTSAFIAQDHFGLTIFSPSAAAIGTGAAPWTGVPLAFAPGTDMDEEDKKEYALNGESAFGTRRPMNFSPDGRFAVRSSWNQGEIEWTVADLSTRKFAKPVKIGRWLNYDPHVGGAANGILACVGPARGAKTSYPLVAVIQELPLARPKTAPTPAYSVAQRQYIEKEQRLEREKGDAMSKSDSQSQKRFFACCVRKR